MAITGGSGFLGRSLARFLAERGYSVTILSRTAPREAGPWTHAAWDARTLGDWTATLDGAAALVNLAGRTVDCVKTPDHCDEILRSRVESTRVLGCAMRQIDTPPPVWVQMSTAHIYGDPPKAVCDEDSAFGHGLAPQVGKAWEAAFTEGKPDDTRGVILRTSFVIGRGGGALARLRSLARFGLGGTVGAVAVAGNQVRVEGLESFVAAGSYGVTTGDYTAVIAGATGRAEYSGAAVVGVVVASGTAVGGDSISAASAAGSVSSESLHVASSRLAASAAAIHRLPVVLMNRP